MGRLDGKSAIVTGAGSGLGRVAAVALAAEGAKVLAADLDGSAAEAVAVSIGNVARGMSIDVAKEEDWDAAMRKARKDMGGLDVLVHGAGLGMSKGLLETSLEEFQAVNRVNVEAFFIGSKAAATLMRETAGEGQAARGSIVAICSVAGLKPVPGAAALSISHDAMRIAARALGVELGRKGDFIRVNSLHTPSMPGCGDAEGDGLLSAMPSDEEVAESIIFLASDESKFMTSAVLTVDSGWSVT